MLSIPDQLYQLFYKIAQAGLVAFAFVFRPATKGVNIAVWQDGKILIIQNAYQKKYTVPGGYVKPGEDHRATAVRELEEEVGLTAWPNQMRHAKMIRYQDQYKRETVHLFELHAEKPVSINIDNREVIWAGFLSPEEALALNLTIPVREYLAGQQAFSSNIM